MKNVLFGTTALAALVLASAAQAAVVKLSLGGFYRAGIGFGEYRHNSTNDDQEADFAIINNGEIHFRGKGSLDNGITIETRVELEVHSDTADQIDEQFVRIGSQFGSIMIGGNDSAANQIGYVGFDKTPVNPAWDGDYNFIPGFVGTFGDNDAAGVHYYTPKIAGFQLGVSYQPTQNLTPDLGAIVDTSQTTDNNEAVLTFGAQYAGTFGDVDVAVGGGYLSRGDGGSTRVEMAWGIGAEVKFSGFGVTGRYETDETFGGTEATRYGFGASYGTGPWVFAAGFAMEETDNSTDDEEQVINAGISYELGDGVTLGGVVMYGDSEIGTAVDEDGFGGAMLLSVNF